MVRKPKIAIYRLSGCGGCDEAILDMNEAILNIADAVDILFWPVLLDFKRPHLEAMKDGEIALSVISGSVRNSGDVDMAGLLRRKSQLVLAFGACACFGGTPGLANLVTGKEILDWVYSDAPGVVNPRGVRPEPVFAVNGTELTLPRFCEQVQSLHQLIDVDYYLPGCPPPPDLVSNAVAAVLEGKLPPKGSTLAPRKALCDTCQRNMAKPGTLSVKDIKSPIKEIRRIHEVEADSGVCFLAQGILCLGPATRTGCGEACININLPCRGCFGPIEGVRDLGARFVSALAAIIDAESEGDIRRVLDRLEDITGYIYRFSLPVSILGEKRV